MPAGLRAILETCEAALGDEVRSTENIASLPNPDRAVLLVRFASGLRVKLRIAKLATSRVEPDGGLVERIDFGGFPKVLIRGDGWAASEWIEGNTVAEHGADPEILDKAGHLLAAVHRARIDPVAGAPEAVLDDVRRKLREKLPVVISHGIITGDQSRRVADLGELLAASRVEMSLIHGDFSPSNLVLRGGEPYSVDNDKMTFHASDYDACRAATLWDEWNESGQSLLESYWKHSCRSASPESLFFWSVFDLVCRISYRVSSFGEFNQFCITRVRELLQAGAFQ